MSEEKKTLISSVTFTQSGTIDSKEIARDRYLNSNNQKGRTTKQQQAEMNVAAQDLPKPKSKVTQRDPSKTAAGQLAAEKRLAEAQLKDLKKRNIQP